ncbi:hypothetical protein MVEN_00367800 [Mycena venus]|uniref:Uncharacterized protein n=1 Tax=Mycena venus TaxID=2733690 RepID=A0A8H6YUM9_9AGAR|nr:hypothetical protein MVEN_00367800 [Mycena venus]
MSLQEYLTIGLDTVENEKEKCGEIPFADFKHRLVADQSEIEKDLSLRVTRQKADVRTGILSSRRFAPVLNTVCLWETTAAGHKGIGPPRQGSDNGGWGGEREEDLTTCEYRLGDPDDKGVIYVAEAHEDVQPVLRAVPTKRLQAKDRMKPKNSSSTHTRDYQILGCCRCNSKPEVSN